MKRGDGITEIEAQAPRLTKFVLLLVIQLILTTNEMC